jgi:uncharacterized protein (DUF952 family)
MTVGPIFHVATPAEWSTAELVGEIDTPSLLTEGFVHCSTEGQLPSTIDRHFAGHDELVLLRLHADRIAAHLRWEEGRPGEDFPHVYRALRLEDVAEVRRWRRPG